MLRYFIWFCCFQAVLAEEWNCSGDEWRIYAVERLRGEQSSGGYGSFADRRYQRVWRAPRVVGGGSNRLFKVESGGELVVKSLNLTGGTSVQVVQVMAVLMRQSTHYRVNSTLKLVNASVWGNVGGFRGGGIKGSSQASIFIINAIVANNIGQREAECMSPRLGRQLKSRIAFLNQMKV